MFFFCPTNQVSLVPYLRIVELEIFQKQLAAPEFWGIFVPDVWTVDVELPSVWQGTKKEVDEQAWKKAINLRVYREGWGQSFGTAPC